MACTQCNYFDGTRCWKNRFNVCCPDKFECPDFVVRDKEKVIIELIKPCPFCGGEAYLYKSENLLGDLFFGVDCESNECIVHTMTAEYPTEEKAIEAWNNRATEAEIRAMAIDEFAEKLKREYVYIDVTSDDMVYGKYRKYIDEIAEQLKGE